MMMADQGFKFGSMDFRFDGDGDCDDFGVSIDADYFYHILDEENFEPLPNGSSYQSAENSQDCGPAVHVGNHKDLLSQTDYAAASENSSEILENLEQLHCPSPAEGVSIEANDASFSKSRNEVGVCELPHSVETNCFPSTHTWSSEFNITSGFPNQSVIDGSNYDLMVTNGGMISNINGDLGDSQASNAWLDNRTALEAQIGDAHITALEVPIFDFFDLKGPESIFHGSHSGEHVDTVNTYDSSSTTTDEVSAEPFYWGLMGTSCEKPVVEMNDEKNNEVLKGYECNSSKANKEAAFHVSFGSGGGNFLASAEAHYLGGVAAGLAVNCHSSTIGRKPSHLQLLQEAASSANLAASYGKLHCDKEEGEGGIVQSVSVKHDPLKCTQEASQASLSPDGNKDDDDDDDLRIIEDTSQPMRLYSSSTYKNSIVTSKRSTFTPQNSTSASSFGVNGTKTKATYERLILQALVQDLSQPKSEADPPDGSLVVPLLRHQRIALSWMVQKETTSLQCSGGILADDQGLGKTVSTIALILTERPSLARMSMGTAQGELETLDLDEDDSNQRRNRISVNSSETFSLARGRPSAGTLIVCPTSVLRQWAEELHNKVASKANLSVLVYHGSNRTKDPFELAKYDVVLTTYSIVSMEVPKQPVVVKDGDSERKSEPHDASIPSSRKRKHPSTSDKRSFKRGMDDALLESVGRPLAKVRWFRVVLDEAQSIKNHRTQVAQACWGLRAKRRWCLSGTPIQNAVDDLYSYFRFLKYDPYCVYKSFCSMVKFPINKNPCNGYRKLQAVLKTVMLRRTKGTRLDGEPIITLPPKSVNLKKVDFSEEERDFYSRLEADSRAQFQAYAASGTVQQNYVNILLMLLRLRQACDHPLLVQGYDSSSALKSSIHVAKKLPREQQICLFNCLETSLAICRICSDPPEDAVVSICGHVFCNQCISERLSGDDNQCPATNCKTHLSVSSVFSKATLKSCLSDRSWQDESHISSASKYSDQRELVEPRSNGRFDSSKIKAALEVLQSLSKPQVSHLDNDVTQPVSDASFLYKSITQPCVHDNKSSGASNSLGNNNNVVKEKAIVFSQWTRMLDLLEVCLKESSIQYRRLDGTMSVVARDKAVRDFNTLPEVSVMIMSLKAASLGLNMVAACHVLLLDLWWNPTTEDQAIDRAHRIGQTRPVTVVRLTVKDTVEDRILALQQKKRELVASAFGEDEAGAHQTRLTVDDLNYLLMA